MALLRRPARTALVSIMAICLTLAACGGGSDEQVDQQPASAPDTPRQDELATQVDGAQQQQSDTELDAFYGGDADDGDEAEGGTDNEADFSQNGADSDDSGDLPADDVEADTVETE